MGLCLLMAANCYASCEEGTEITGKNGYVYCRSNIAMNWFTAFSWCEMHGRTLATMEQLCSIDEAQKWDGNTGEGKCLNLMGSENDVNMRGWSANPYESEEAFIVQLSKGEVRVERRLTPYYDKALCW